MTHTLKPCPHCGGDASEEAGMTANVGGEPYRYVTCLDCSAQADFHDWNTRTIAADTLTSAMELPKGFRRVVHELRLSMQVFRDYGYQHQDKAEAAESDRERADRERKAKRNFDRASVCEAALDDLDAAMNAARTIDDAPDARPDVVGVLAKCREAIASLEVDGLGMATIAFGTPGVDVYPIRDELIAEIDAALANAVDGPSGFDPSRVRQLLDAVAPICAIIADYATHPGPVHESHDRVLGRIGRAGESPPYATWGQLCAIEDAAYALARGTEAAEFAHDSAGGNAASPEGHQP